MKKITALLAEFAAMALVIVMGAVTLSMTSGGGTALAAPSDNVEKCKHTFLGLKPWYQYIGNNLNDGTTADNPGMSADEAKKNLCNVRCFNIFTMGKDADGNQLVNECGQTSSDIPPVLLAIADDLLRIAALISLGFVIVGAFKYVGSQGNPDSTAKAQDTIVNALLGLAISVSAVAIVSFIGNKIGS